MSTRQVRTRPVRIGAVLGRDLMLAPMVAFLRLPLMAAEAGSGEFWATETALAVNEKAAALVEGALAAQWSLMASAARFWPEVLAGRTPAVLSGAAVARAVNAALKSAGRRVRANFRRLAAGS
jgi:hypothetical protein